MTREDFLELNVVKKAIRDDVMRKMEETPMSHKEAVQEFRVRMRRNGWVAPYTSGAVEIANFRRFTGKCPLLNGLVILAPIPIKIKSVKHCSFSCPQLRFDGFCKHTNTKLKSDLNLGAYKRDPRCIAYDEV